jgi:hypothetical protein
MQVEKFPLYLRVLDFKDAGTPEKEICKCLFPKFLKGLHEQGGHDDTIRMHEKISQTLDAAHRWQRDYLTIAHRP